MTYDKQVYEKLIEETILFKLDKNTQMSLYKRESLKLVEYLYCYIMASDEDKYEDVGCEIVEVATRCINRYDGSGPFLHYFNAAWKKEFLHVQGSRLVDKQFQGMKITEQDKRNVKKYFTLLKKKGRTFFTKEEYAEIANLMGISKEKVESIVQLAEFKVGDYYYNSEENEEQCILEETDFNLPSCKSADKIFYVQEAVGETIKTIEKIFYELQDRQKPIVSDMLTIKLYLEIDTEDNILDTYPFLNGELLKEILKTGNVPTQRDIAEKYNRNEASISRTMKEFTNKLRGLISGETI